MSKIYIVLFTTCSELGFPTPSILGTFSSKEDAEECKRKYCINNIINNYKTFILTSYVQYPSFYKSEDISNSVKDGYEVA